MPGSAARRAAPVASEKTASGKSISSQISQASAVSPPGNPHQPDMPRVGRFLLDGERFEGRDQLLVVVDDRNAIARDEALEGVVVCGSGRRYGPSVARAPVADRPTLRTTIDLPAA